VFRVFGGKDESTQRKYAYACRAREGKNEDAAEQLEIESAAVSNIAW
jgi:hypothetical protein